MLQGIGLSPDVHIGKEKNDLDWGNVERLEQRVLKKKVKNGGVPLNTTYLDRLELEKTRFFMTVEELTNNKTVEQRLEMDP